MSCTPDDLHPPPTGNTWLLIAHGARDPQWRQPFDRVVELLRQSRPDVAVSLAFLDHMSPNIADAARELVHRAQGRITLIPLFLGAGGHVRQDLPQALSALQATYPHVEWVLLPSIGEMPAFVMALAQCLSNLQLADPKCDETDMKLDPTVK